MDVALILLRWLGGLLVSKADKASEARSNRRSMRSDRSAMIVVDKIPQIHAWR